LENIEAEKIKFTPDYEAGKPVFWHVFKELSNNNNGLVSYYNLQERLVATGQFFVGEAVSLKSTLKSMLKRTLKRQIPYLIGGKEWLYCYHHSKWCYLVCYIDCC
jgi:hypothetical protein